MLFYILSVLYLFIMFLSYKKSDKKISIISSIIYAIALLFCYNTVIVYFNSLLNIDGSLLVFSIINSVVATILGGVTLKRKKIQKYQFNKKEFVVVACLIIVIFLIGYFRFRGFTSISYESGDSAIHYRQAVYFSEKLSLLNEYNSKDMVYKDFRGAMPISYVNAGILLNLFSNFKPYKVFFCYDTFCLMLCSLLFFSTISKVLNAEKKSFLFVLTLLYTLAYPMNSFLFGFCYLGLGVMVANLLYLTIIDFDKTWNNNFIYKLVIMFILCFSLFFSYYLFVPCLYLAVGLYYIYLWKLKDISFTKMFLYGGITLVIPFVIGFVRFFLLPRYIMVTEPSISFIIGSWGYSYQNFTPIYVFVMVSFLMLFELFQKEKKEKKNVNILNFIMYILMAYIFIFLVLYIFKVVSAYYLYKLFYLYWLFVIIVFIKKLVVYQKYIYLLFGIVLMLSCYILVWPDTRFTNALVGINIYHYNTRSFADNRITYNSDEVKLMEHTIKYKDVCNENNHFIIIGGVNKNVWFYSVTGMIPTMTPINGDSRNLYSMPNPTLDGWDRVSEYNCAVYFYDGYENEEIDELRFEVLYENDGGAILKRRDL